MRFRCSRGGEHREGLPDVAFDAPFLQQVYEATFHDATQTGLGNTLTLVSVPMAYAHRPTFMIRPLLRRDGP